MEYIKLEDYCLSVRDGTHDTPQPSIEGNYLVTSKAISNNAIDFSQCYKISETDYNKINKRSKVNVNDVLMTMIGTVGRLYLVKDEPNYAIKNIALFKIGNELKAKWLYYYCSTKAMQNYFNLIATGTSQHFISLSHLRDLKIEIIRNNAEKIVSILSQYDVFIENNNKRINLLEQMAENSYKHLFAYYKTHDCAEEIKLSQVIKIVRGVSYSSEEIEATTGNNLINLKNIQGFGGFRRDGLKVYNGKFKQEQTVNYGDLVMGVTDMTQDRRTVGAVALIPKLNGISIISADLIKLVSDINKNFLYSMFRYGELSKHISQFANGANVLHLKPQAVLDTKIMLPEQPLIDKYISIVEPIFNQIEHLNICNQNLTKQRDLLLPRLMSGKLQMN